MFRTARSFLYYAFFAALSLLLHAWLLFPRRSLPDPAQMANLARQIQIDLQQIESLLPEAEDAPPPKIKETPKPLEDVSQPDPLPATKEPEPSPASAAPEDPAEAPVEHSQVLSSPPPEPTETAIATLDEYRRFLARE
ncbi:MAG: hypothetical protein HYY16_10545, partial [Planctomycetes bacterium]|nr:hypothetical protein [Planctomycetota bacterium]